VSVSEDLGLLTLGKVRFFVHDLTEAGSRPPHLAIGQFESWSSSATLNLSKLERTPAGAAPINLLRPFSVALNSRAKSRKSASSILQGFAPGTYAAKLLSNGELVTVVRATGRLSRCSSVELSQHALAYQPAEVFLPRMNANIKTYVDKAQGFSSFDTDLHP